MNKIILTQICKDEKHVIGRMFESIKGFVDIICIVDTGSTDGTQEYIKQWGIDNNIETHVFDRPFDNFENSRNYSIQQAKSISENKSDNNTYYGFWLDCDEELIIDDSFDKSKLNKDLYMVTTNIGQMMYTRNELFKLSKKFEFYGPVHEYIIPKEPNITSGSAQGIRVNVKMDGNSWKGDISKKYKSHSEILEDYLLKDRNPRWVFYTAQSWHDSATTKSKTENDERLRRSLNFYKERVSTNDGYHEERYYSQFRVGLIRNILEHKWSEVESELLKAYSIDPLRGESIKVIIEHYQKIGEWNLAYLYSEFAYNNFHNKSPYPTRLLFVDQSLYTWRFLELHMNTLFYMNRIDESKKLAKELLTLTKMKGFVESDRKRIENNVGQINTRKISKVT